MATEKQKKAIENVVENHGNVSKAMRDAGYSEKTAKNPKNLTQSKAWNELMEQHLPDELLAKVHKKLLQKQEIQTRNNNSTKKIEVVKTGQPHTDVKNALDMAYKLKGHYSPEKSEVKITDYNNLSDEQLDDEIKKRKNRIPQTS